MIELKRVSKIYYQNGQIATGFSRISTKFNIGEFVVIVGESGSGKSTLLNVLSGLDTYEEGEMYINGEETSHYGEKEFEEYRNKYIANIFQAFNLVNSYTVKQNVELALLINGFNKSDAKKKVIDILKKVDLYKLRNRRVSRLSGGQKQRVAIARALAKETPIIVADEPTGNLDEKSAKEIFKLLSEIAKDKLVIVVSHNLEYVEKYATRIIKMHDGKIVEEKNVKEYKEVEIEEKNISYMSFFNKLRISIRNSFNVIPKFLLLLAVFMVFSYALVNRMYSVFQENYDELSNGSDIFVSKNPERIVVRKNDKTPLTENDYNYFNSLKHVAKIDEFDASEMSLSLHVNYNEEEIDSPFGYINTLDNVDITLIEGVMPKENGEILLVYPKYYYYMDYAKEYVLNKDAYFSNGESVIDYSKTVKIVGIATFNDDEIFDASIVVVPSYFNELITSWRFISLYNNFKTNIFGNMKIIASPLVNDGEIVFSNNLNIYCKYGYCNRKKLTITVEDLYYTKTKEYILNNGMNNKKLDNKFHLGDKFNYDNYLFISPNDLADFVNSEKYQASIYADNYELVDELSATLQNAGYYALPIKNTIGKDTSFEKLFAFIKIFGTIFVLIVLVAITSLVINIILKSRNKYYAVVRMLGGSLKLNRDLISIELCFISTLSYIIIIGFHIYNHYYHIMETDIFTYFKFIHIIIIYVILLLLSLIISKKFAKSIFKDSMINTYNMEV